ncbi:MAG: acyl-CoA dehydrogenase, partial [Caulobacter sp. 12-67-6]
MDFNPPPELTAYLAVLDRFIEDEIAPLQARDDNERFFDHRREWARTDWDGGGLPRHDWEELLARARKLADAAGHYRFALPREFGGQDGSNLWMAVIREHLASKGLGLFNDLQNEHSIVGNNPFVLMIRDFGRPDQQHLIGDMLDRGAFRPTFGLTEPEHGSDA